MMPPEFPATEAMSQMRCAEQKSKRNKTSAASVPNEMAYRVFAVIYFYKFSAIFLSKSAYFILKKKAGGKLMKQKLIPPERK